MTQDQHSELSLRSAAEYLSSRLTLKPNPVELENAADLILDLIEQVQALETQLAGAEGGWQAADRLKEQYGTLRAAVDDLISHYRAEPDHEYRVRFWESFDQLREIGAYPANGPLREHGRGLLADLEAHNQERERP